MSKPASPALKKKVSIILPLKSQNTITRSASLKKPKKPVALYFKNMIIKKSDVELFAKKIGRHLLKNDKYMDRLSDALDGIEISETEEEYDSESAEE